MTFLARTGSELRQLLVLAGVTLALPLLLPADSFQDSSRRIVFDRERLDRVVRQRPNVVMIGNSMLNTRVKKPLFNRMSRPNKVVYLAEGGTRSTVWWFMLKNFAGPMRPPPAVVFIFYRDYDFTSPGLHLDGSYLEVARAFMRPEDEELLAAMRKTTGAATHPLMDFYLPDKMTQAVRRRVSELAIDFGAAGQGKEGDNQLEEDLNNLFDFENLRANVLDAGAVANDIVPPDTRNFSLDPANSLLGLFNDFARQRGIRLVFYRVKRRPGEDQQVRQDADLTAYTRSFREWAESQGHALVDETEDPRLLLSMYHDGDHLAAAAMDAYTRMFMDRIRHLLPVPPAPAPEP